MEEIKNKLFQIHTQVINHSMYNKIKTINDVRTFMEVHVWAVWDFMSILKGIQSKITCTTVPWRPTHYPKELVRFVNEIVLGEESDVNFEKGYTDHFSLYVEAMKEIGANTKDIEQFLVDLEISKVDKTIAQYVSFHVNLGMDGKLHEQMAAFFYGREHIIPEMFSIIVNVLEKSKVNCPKLLYYLKRHIELDGDEHSLMAKKCLETLCDNSTVKWTEAYDCAHKSLLLRYGLWNLVEKKISNRPKEIINR